MAIKLTDDNPTTALLIPHFVVLLWKPENYISVFAPLAASSLVVGASAAPPELRQAGWKRGPGPGASPGPPGSPRSHAVRVLAVCSGVTVLLKDEARPGALWSRLSSVPSA